MHLRALIASILLPLAVVVLAQDHPGIVRSVLSTVRQVVGFLH